MSREEQLARIQRTGIVAIVRTTDGSRLADAAEALVAGGVDVLEITFTVPQAHKILETVAGRLGTRLLLGAGTVLDPETARIALLSGAEFIVSPATNMDVIRLCRRYSKIVMPGALTPTEVLTAWEAGADFVKIFPSELFGPAYLKALSGPYPQIRFIPTGGISAANAADYLQAGASAVGVGTSLLDPKALARGDFTRLEEQARQLVGIVRAARGESTNHVER